MLVSIHMDLEQMKSIVAAEMGRRSVKARRKAMGGKKAFTERMREIARLPRKKRGITKGLTDSNGLL